MAWPSSPPAPPPLVPFLTCHEKDRWTVKKKKKKKKEVVVVVGDPAVVVVVVAAEPHRHGDAVLPFEGSREQKVLKK